MPICDIYAEMEGWTPETFTTIESRPEHIVESAVSASIEEQNAAVRREVAGGIDTRATRIGEISLKAAPTGPVNGSKGIKPNPQYL